MPACRPPEAKRQQQLLARFTSVYTNVLDDVIQQLAAHAGVPPPRPVGIAQALLHHWNRSLDQIPAALASIFQQTGEELLHIPVSGYETTGDPVFHLQLQAYEEALDQVTNLARPDISPLLHRVLQHQNPFERTDIFGDLLRIIERGGNDSATALTIFQLVHTRARRWYLQFQTGTLSDDEDE